MSKSSYGVETPKHSPRTRNGKKDTEQHADSHEAGEPACRTRAVGHSAGNREWREIAYDERRVTSYRPCAWPECFPSGSPDASEIETVIRSAHRPTVYHRPRTATDSQPCDPSRDERAVEQQAVSAITELRDGDRVIWDSQRWSMRVTETATDPDGVVALVGVDGGVYRIEGRPTAARSYAVYPSIGVVEGLCRVVTDDGYPETV